MTNNSKTVELPIELQGINYDVTFRFAFDDFFNLNLSVFSIKLHDIQLIGVLSDAEKIKIDAIVRNKIREEAIKSFDTVFGK